MKEKGKLQEKGFLRINQILEIIPIGRSTWWRKVKSGEYPQPVKLGSKTTAWRVEDIKELIDGINKGGFNDQ